MCCFSDKNDNGEIGNWAWSSSSGWQLQNFFGDEVEPKTSPSAVVENGDAHYLLLPIRTDNGEMAAWVWNPT